MSIQVIAFDADDTLWVNETYFREAEDKFCALLEDYLPHHSVAKELFYTELQNIPHYGYGVKGFMLSMIETAIEVTEGRVEASVIAEILAAGREMLRHPVDLLPHARAAVEALAAEFKVLVITKGDLLDQERKVAQSGLGNLFHGVEIVSDKTPEVYRRIFARHGTGASQAMMVGNSLKSDVLPAIAAGGWGVHVPHGITWALEHAEPPQAEPRFHSLPSLETLPDLVGQIKATHNL